MKNKYYTPELEEFHIGFEYEIIYDDEIKPAIFNAFDMMGILRPDTKNTLGGIMWKIRDRRVRVKFLDSEDIESLGFKYLINMSLFCTYKKDNYYIYEHPSKNHYFIITDGVWRGDIPQPDNAIFEGTVKNKSELVKLFKQLNIDITNS